MLEFIRDIFEFRFLGYAVMACLLAGIACGIIGTYIVCRRLVFLSGGITHASFGGIGIAYYFGLNPIAGAGVFAVLSALSMEALSQKMKIREDSAIGILWSVGMAVGIVFMTLTPGYAPNLMSFLFGNILSITQADLIGMTILVAVLLVVFALFYRPILYIAFDREYARTQNLPVTFVNSLMMVLTALTIVLSIRLVGIVMLISLLTIPPVIVNSVSKSYRKITVWSCAICTLGTFFGVFFSDKTDIPPGPSTIIVLGLALIVVKSIVFFHKKR